MLIVIAEKQNLNRITINVKVLEIHFKVNFEQMNNNDRGIVNP